MKYPGRFTRRIVLRRAVLGLGAAGLASVMTLGAASAEQTIKIGVITDKTGNARFYAEPVLQGILLAAKVVNAEGGLLGKKIELVIEDDGNKPDVSASKAQKLIDAGVVAIISNSSSTSSQQAQNTTIKTLTPQVTHNGSDTLTRKLDNKCFFQIGPLGSIQIRTLMSYARSKNYKRVALMTDNTALGQILAKFFKISLEKSGAKVVVEQVVPAGAKSALPQMQKVRAAKPDAIFQAAILGREMVLFFRAYHQLGMKQQVLGSFNLSIPTYLRTAKDLMEGVAFIDAFDPAKPEAQAFIAHYKKEHGKTPFSLPGYGYDDLMFVVQAIKRAGSTDKAKVCAALQATKGYRGVMGAKTESYGFPAGKRTGFPPEGAVVRLIKDNKHGPVVHAGTK
ncbi:MAG: ABC transporter substrate-binding protein [Alphaproteobacteria bacterium]|nr:ABC transporter substrate-binding protein [Alphaproteobacteria bacterium]